LAGQWSSRTDGSDFEVTLREGGSQISGDMTGTAMNGNRVSIGVFNGTRQGDSVRLEWRFKDGDVAGPVAGTASVARQNGNTLHWQLTYEGAGDCWFPRDAILRRNLQ
jgi:hypothetical protein